MLPEGIRQRYGELPGELVLLELEKDRQGLGLSLAGNRDRKQISIFVVGITAGGPAYKDGRIQVGDELLEINNQVLYGRSHQSASAVIKSAPLKVKILLVRNREAINQLAVPAFPTPPPPIVPNENIVKMSSEREKPHPDEVKPKSLVKSIIVKMSSEREKTLPDEVKTKTLVKSNIVKMSSEREKPLPDEVKTKSLVKSDLAYSTRVGPQEAVVKSLETEKPSNLLKMSSEREKPHPDEVKTKTVVKSADSLPNIPGTTSELLMDAVDTSTSTPAAPPPCTSPDSPDCSKDPTVCPILPGLETIIEISKGRSGLGLSIVGGKDTQLVQPSQQNLTMSSSQSSRNTAASQTLQPSQNRTMPSQYPTAIQEHSCITEPNNVIITVSHSHPRTQLHHKPSSNRTDEHFHTLKWS